MAHIFLSYVGSTARVKPLRDSLARQGHKVYSLTEFRYSTPAALEKLAEFDLVIAVWSEGADGDESFIAIATEAARLERLISVRAPGLSADALPEPFRHLSSLPVSDSNGLSTRIAALPRSSVAKNLPPIQPERPMGVGASDSAPYRIDAIRPLAAERTLGQGPSQTAANQKAVAFDVERQSETTQLVINDLITGSAFEKEDFGRWTWLVTPKKPGAHQLILKVSAGLKDSRGVPTSARLPDREFKVSVSVNKGKATIKFLRRSAIGLGGAVGAAMLGTITQELWWPKIKALLQAWGLIG